MSAPFGFVMPLSMWPFSQSAVTRSTPTAPGKKAMSPSLNPCSASGSSDARSIGSHATLSCLMPEKPVSANGCTTRELLVAPAPSRTPSSPSARASQPGLSTGARRYESPAYRAILPLRTAHSDGVVVLIDGVSPDHRGPDALAGRPTARKGLAPDRARR
jgi:hypothetical protein